MTFNNRPKEDANAPESKTVPPRVIIEFTVLSGSIAGFYIKQMELRGSWGMPEEYLSLSEHNQILASYIKRAEEGERDNELHLKNSAGKWELISEIRAQLAAEKAKSEKLVAALEKYKNVPVYGEQWHDRAEISYPAAKALAEYVSPQADKSI